MAQIEHPAANAVVSTSGLPLGVLNCVMKLAGVDMSVAPFSAYDGSSDCIDRDPQGQSHRRTA